jgi:hypothetical protein
MSTSPAEEQALRTLYRQCGGETWLRREGWLHATDVCAWEGITCDRGRVTSLSLPRNRLKGTLPTEIGLLAYLEALDLSGNALTGAVPAEMGHLRRLRHLDLADNDLRGALPERLRLLRRLRHLDMHGNQLSGTIPATLGELTALEYLDLSQNRFVGTAPAEFGRLTHLVTLRINQNDLGGPLPPEWTALRALGTFAFDQTNLLERSDPTFQTWLGSIAELHRTGVLHAEVVTLGAENHGLLMAAVAGMGAFGAILVGTIVVLLPFLGPIAAPIAAIAGAAGGGLAGRYAYKRITGSDQGGPNQALPERVTGQDSDSDLRAALKRELRELVSTTRTELPPDLADQVGDIEATLLDLLPRIKRLSSGDADAYVVRQTIRDYLPEALASYRALPRDFATQQPIQGGETAHDHLLAQLEVLHQGLRQIAARKPEEDAQQLLIHRRFLEGKFRDADLASAAASPLDVVNGADIASTEDDTLANNS